MARKKQGTNFSGMPDLQSIRQARRMRAFFVITDFDQDTENGELGTLRAILQNIAVARQLDRPRRGRPLNVEKYQRALTVLLNTGTKLKVHEGSPAIRVLFAAGFGSEAAVQSLVRRLADLRRTHVRGNWE